MLVKRHGGGAHGGRERRCYFRTPGDRCGLDEGFEAFRVGEAGSAVTDLGELPGAGEWAGTCKFCAPGSSAVSST
ncbi:hypothetical protein AB4212_35965, partial [Streptomyces sp. 2MCAF27]